MCKKLLQGREVCKLLITIITGRILLIWLFENPLYDIKILTKMFSYEKPKNK